MNGPSYKEGQVVRLDYPRGFYGTVTKLEPAGDESQFSHKGVITTYGGLGVVIEFMRPIKSLRYKNNERTTHSTYPFNHPIFGNAVHVVDNLEEEISKLEREAKGLETKDSDSRILKERIKKSIDYLRGLAKKTDESSSDEQHPPVNILKQLISLPYPKP